MKTPFISVVLLTAALMVGGITACNTNQQRTAANTLSATHDVVSKGVDSFYAATVTGLASTNGIAPVGAAYDKFQKVYLSAVILARNNTNALAPDNVMQEASSIAAVIGEFYQPAANNIKNKLQIK